MYLYILYYIYAICCRTAHILPTRRVWRYAITCLGAIWAHSRTYSY